MKINRTNPRISIRVGLRSSRHQAQVCREPEKCGTPFLKLLGENDTERLGGSQPDSEARGQGLVEKFRAYCGAGNCGGDPSTSLGMTVLNNDNPK